MSLNIEGTAPGKNGDEGYAGRGSADYARALATTGANTRGFRPALWPTLAAALCIPLFLAAGQWQWNKAALKMERQQQRDARSAQPALAMPATQAAAETLSDRRVIAEGRYEPQFQILIDNRTHNGQAGYHVVTPLRVDSGDGSNVRLLVNRGWIPAPADRQTIPSFPTPTGHVQISGLAIVPPTRYFSLASSGENSQNGQAWQSVWQNLDLARYRTSVVFPVQPVVLLLDPPQARRDTRDASDASDANDTGSGFIRDWPRPDDKRQINLGYALQWWTFAATTFVLWLIHGFRRPAPRSSTD